MMSASTSSPLAGDIVICAERYSLSEARDHPELPDKLEKVLDGPEIRDRVDLLGARPIVEGCSEYNTIIGELIAALSSTSAAAESSPPLHSRILLKGSRPSDIALWALKYPELVPQVRQIDLANPASEATCTCYSMLSGRQRTEISRLYVHKWLVVVVRAFTALQELTYIANPSQGLGFDPNEDDPDLEPLQDILDWSPNLDKITYEATSRKFPRGRTIYRLRFTSADLEVSEDESVIDFDETLREFWRSKWQPSAGCHEIYQATRAQFVEAGLGERELQDIWCC